MNKTLKITLVFSLLLNLLFSGIIVGHFLKRMDDSPRKWNHTRIEKALETLPESQRSSVENAATELHKLTRDLRIKSRKAHTETFDMLLSDPIDSVRYEEQVQAWIQMNEQFQRSISQLILQSTQDMNADQRQAFVNLLKTPAKRMHHTGTDRKTIRMDTNQ
jgi:uncharacterized membrane protein